MTDEQLRILCATILCAVSYAGEADCVSISETTAAEWADRINKAGRASAPTAPAAADHLVAAPLQEGAGSATAASGGGRG